MAKKITLYAAGIIFLVIVLCSTLFIRSIKGLTIKDGQNFTSIYIPTGATYKQVTDSISARIIIRNKGIFDWVAARKKYPLSVKPGHYILTGQMTYFNVINTLRSGSQVPVNVTFNHIRTIYELAAKIGHQIEADSTKIINFLKNSSNYSKDGFSRETIIAVFIPDTYELYWNTSPEGLYKRMLKEYKSFWNRERLSLAHEKNLTPIGVSILASIVDEEALVAEEKPRIAGVYLNRLNKKMKLDADPTVKFAVNDFTITRLLNKHLQIDSPYNTYKHPGLPPGPIGCPSIDGINAVLHAENNDYYFFVAKADFSGYHYFSKTMAEHLRNAALYQKELDKRKIFK